MCGRFSVYLDEPELRNSFPNHDISTLKDVKISNFAPTMEMPIILENQVVNMCWGLIPSWARDKSFANKLINARGETLLEKPSFKNLVNTQRCIVTSNGFYEWNPQTKQPFFIQPTNRSLMNFGGLHTLWIDGNGHPVNTFTIITTNANQSMSDVHHRMPVILDQGNEQEWLSRKNNFTSIQHFIKPIHESEISVTPITKVV
ncbi:MAG: SOS response-associated peptidase [Chloroflexota bacterium]|nr:SOS response-associated peptidase [Chloroflexota bacterium]MEC9366309.1 SOS response-associated peptidase [Chloroflexota bacterium]MED5450847.1 SOS response-associated peptidase [Chloroflexota bacterium]MED6296001.1 SOS response-associated peptidase [Chloroflexota bacterium]|tara:strand:- start:363 stop:968 length:606 start_codon:yes stop_codon:yes gene_type:complete